MKTLIICDIDGVLADCGHRLHYKDEGDYDNFYGVTMLDDKEIPVGRNLLIALRESVHYDARALWFLTGRPERTRRLTELWLGQVLSLYSQKLIMRADRDHSESPKMKVKALKALKKQMSEFDRVYFIDDDPENVKAVCAAFPQITGLTFGVGRM